MVDEVFLGSSTEGPGFPRSTGVHLRASRLKDFQRPMLDLSSKIAEIDIRKIELLGAEEARQAIHPVALELVAAARRLVGGVVDACEALREEQPGQAAAASEPSLGFELALDLAVEAGDSTVHGVEDVAFLVQLELRQRAERLTRIGEGSTVLTVVGECESALRRIAKGLGAIDLAIARAEEVPPLLDFSSELESSLLVRGAYAKFRTNLLAHGTPRPEELYGFLRAAGTAIAVLVGWQAYPLLRVRDRLQLRELQQRILGWLRPENRDDRTEGARIWQDVVTFVDMLMHVNRRQELLEHDACRLSELLAELGEGAASEGSVARARTLLGLDDELDAFLAAAGPHDARALRDLLAPIAARLGPQAGT